MKAICGLSKYLFCNIHSIHYSPLFYRSSQRYKDCEITGLSRKYHHKPYAFALQPDSPYIGLFNYYIGRLRENGALRKSQDECEPDPQECPDQTGEALGIKNCFGAFLVMVAGFGCGLMILAIECVMKPTVETGNQSNSIEEEDTRTTPEQLDVRRLRVEKPLKRRHGLKSPRPSTRWITAHRRLSRLRAATEAFN